MGSRKSSVFPSGLLLLATFCAQSNGQCHNGWTVHQQSCYLFMKETYNWFEAKATCEVLKGHLVEIETAEENLFVAGLVHSHGDANHPWIGLNDFEEEGIFKWVSTNQPAEVYYWGSGEPDDSHGHEDCAGIVSTGRWFDGTCNTDHRPFICEMERPNEGDIIG